MKKRKKNVWVALGLVVLMGGSSCRNYDNAISFLQEQIDQNKASIEQLRALVSTGGTITSVDVDGKTIMVKASDGREVTIGGGENGAVVWTIGSDSLWHKNGERQEEMWAINRNPGGAYYVPNADGYFYIHNGSATPTKTDKQWKSIGLTAIWNTNKQTLTFYGVDGNANTPYVISLAQITFNGGKVQHINNLGDSIVINLPTKDYIALRATISTEGAIFTKASGSSNGWEYTLEIDSNDSTLAKVKITKRSLVDTLAWLHVTLIGKDDKEYSASCVLKSHLTKAALDKVYPSDMTFDRADIKKIVFLPNVSESDSVNYTLTGFSNNDWVRGKWEATDGILTIATTAEMFALQEGNLVFYNFSTMTSIQGMEYLNTEKVTNMSFMFSECNAITSLDLSSLNTDSVTNMSGMFRNCEALSSLDLSNFNTEEVTIMESMFEGCNALTLLDLSSFNTKKITYMENMFQKCKQIKLLILGMNFIIPAEYYTGMFNQYAIDLTSSTISAKNPTTKAKLETMKENNQIPTNVEITD